jgi:hypothetical protein
MSTESKAPPEVKPEPKRRQMSRFRLMALRSAAARERASLPADHPRKKITLPRLARLDERRHDREDERA